MNNKLLTASLGIAVLFLFGCSTPEKVARMEGKGPSRVYNAPYDATWKAAVDSAWGLGLTVLRVNPKEGFISTKRGMTPTTFGEDVGIWLKDAGAGRTQVEVVSRQKGVPFFEFKHWEDDVFRAIGEKLGSAPVAAYGSSPGTTTSVRASGSSADSTGLLATPHTVPSNQAVAGRPAPDAKAGQPDSVSKQPAKPDPLTEQVILRERLRRYLVTKESELNQETEPKRRQLIQYEMEYMREELNKLDAKLSNVPKK